MATVHEMIERGFPVTLRLCELPGFAAFVQDHEAALSRVERTHLGDWLVVVDAEELEAGESIGALIQGLPGAHARRARASARGVRAARLRAINGAREDGGIG